MYNAVSNILDKTSKLYPDKIAFSDTVRCITYKELQKEALVVANRLISYNIHKSAVMVFLEKSISCVSCFMGINYSGNYYSIVDIENPNYRIKHIIENFDPIAIITERKYEDRIKSILLDAKHSSKLIFFSDIKTLEIDIDKIHSVAKQVSQSDLFSVIYTSGSTGIPKGVVVSNGAVLELVDSFTEEFDIKSDYVFGNHLPLHFVASMIDIYVVINSGAETCLFPQKLFSDPGRLKEYFEKHKNINTIAWSVSALSLFSKAGYLNMFRDMSIDNVFFMGGVLPQSVVFNWKKVLPAAQFINLYASTEGLWSFFYRVGHIEDVSDTIPTGFPFKNREALILNDELKRVGSGETGELYIRTNLPYVGYYRDYEMTNKVYVNNPLNRNCIEKLYKTGDLAKINEKGELEIVGRTDTQFKHIGYRVNSEEIENNVLDLNGVLESCCIYDECAQQIVLYYSGTISEMELLRLLKDRIPRYMLPSRIENMDSIPHTSNGKIDRYKLRDNLKKNTI